MSKRNPYIIERTLLPRFGAWLAERGWSTAPTKGYFEAARFVHAAEKPIILFRSSYTGDALTVQEKDVPLVEMYLARPRKQAQRKLATPTTEPTR